MGAFTDEELALIGGSDQNVGTPTKQLVAPAPPPSNNDLSPLTDSNGESAITAPAKPVAKSPYTHEEQALMTAPDSQRNTAPINAGEPSGTSPQDAIAESPIGILDRAWMGWARTAPEQVKYLKTMFDDVQTMDTPEGGAALVVKDKDGKWYQTDPNFHWTKSAAGINVPAWDSHNAKALGGALGHMFGEYQLRADAAMTAGSAAAAAAVETGPIGMAAAGLAGGAAGAYLAEGADLTSRKMLTKAVGDYPGAEPYKNPAEVHQQMMASALLGAMSWGGGKLLEKGIGMGTKMFGKVLETMAGTEGGRLNASKLLGAMGGNEGLIEARMMNPKQTSTFDEMVKQDGLKSLKTPGQTDAAEDAAFNALNEDMTSALNREQGEFAKMQVDPKVQSLQLNNAQIVQQPLNILKQNKIVTPDGRLVPMNQGGVYGEGDAKVIGYFRALANKENTQTMSYQDVRQEVQKISTLLNGKVQNNQLYQLLTQTKNALNDSVVAGLGPETGPQYKALLNKYATVRQTMSDLSQATAGNKKNTFISKMVNTDKRTIARDLIGGLQQAGVPFNNVEKLLQIQAAREAAPIFARANLKITNVPLPLPSANRIARGAAATYDSMSQLGSSAQKQISGSIPYTAKTLSFLKKLPPDQLKQILTTPQLYDSLATMTASGAVGQKLETDNLLKSVGINGNGSGNK